MDKISLELLKEIAHLDGLPQGAYNIRENGKGIARNCTADIDIETKKDKPDIDIYIKKGTKGKSVHIPVMLTQTGLNDMVYNDFYVAENCDVIIVAGCGIYNCGNSKSEHDGIHTFHIGKNSKVVYIERHLGIGTQNSEKVLNPSTTEAQIAKTKFIVRLAGKKSSVDVLSRSVAKNSSTQEFRSTVIGQNECFG